jgi:hypothetical protein
LLCDSEKLSAIKQKEDELQKVVAQKPNFKPKVGEVSSFKGFCFRLRSFLLPDLRLFPQAFQKVGKSYF